MDNKSLYYDKIDYSVVSNAWNILEPYIKLPFVIHIVGTNGKGSTGRFLASILYQQNKRVLHYSSPHIVKFNERIWIDGKNIDDSTLDETHIKLCDILPNDILVKLTYFEYTTLLALYISSGFDYIVLEAGLGGEFDATNVVKNDLTLITTIGLDHQEFLGDTIEQIATTKLKSCDNSFILGYQRYDIVKDIAKTVLKDKKEYRFNRYNLDINLPQYLQQNLFLALSCLEMLGFGDINYSLPPLFGRYQKIAPNITIDVGHNTLAATSIKEQLEKENKKVILVYNSYKDKDYKSILTILAPFIKEVQIIKCEDTRIVDTAILEDTIKSLGLKCGIFTNNIDDRIDYLVFGSFLVVEQFIKQKGDV